MREIRLYGSEGGGTGCSPYPYQQGRLEKLDSEFRRNDGGREIRSIHVQKLVQVHQSAGEFGHCCRA